MRLHDPYTALNQLRHEFDRLFESTPAPNLNRGTFLPGRNPRSYPLVNVAEDKDVITVEALAPGLDPEQIDITVHRDKLTIAGEKKSHREVADRNIHRSERATGRFTRSFTLPSDVDADKVTADYRNGILTVSLPKAESAKPKSISVATA